MTINDAIGAIAHVPRLAARQGNGSWDWKEKMGRDEAELKGRSHVP